MPQQTAKKSLKRYQVKKSVMAESLVDALLLEKQANVEHVWLDDNQPEEKTALIGFRYEEPEEVISYSPILKRKK